MITGTHDNGSSGQDRRHGERYVLTSIYRGLLRASRDCGLTLADERWQVENRHRGVEYIDHQHVVELWEDIAKEPDPLFGLRLGLAIEPHYLGPVGVLLYCCPDLRTAVVSLEDFAIVLREPSNMHVGLVGDVLPEVTDSAYPHWHLRSLTMIGCVIRAVSEITGHQVRHPTRVLLASPAQAPLERYTRLIGCHVEFEQNRQAILFSSEQGHTELRYADPALERRLRRVVAETLRSQTRDSMRARVRDVLVAEPQLSKEQAADRLHMSSRTLHRLLEAEGLSFLLLSRAVRERLAREELQNSDKSVAEIAEQLGFADESSFSRAFKRWTGATPGEFRERSR